MSGNIQIINGDSRTALRQLDAESVHCCVTSPPYFNLRDYGMEGQIGQEKTPDEYVATMVQIFQEVKRVLRNDGTIWINLGDSYAASGCGGNPVESIHHIQDTNAATVGLKPKNRKKNLPSGLKPKDLIGIPWRVALALQADGWYLRSDIIWAKANCMPESVTSRPTRSHEYIFLLSKSERYHYDHEAIKEPCIYDVNGTGTAARKTRASADLKSHPTAERSGIRPQSVPASDRRAFRQPMAVIKIPSTLTGKIRVQKNSGAIRGGTMVLMTVGMPWKKRSNAPA